MEKDFKIILLVGTNNKIHITHSLNKILKIIINLIYVTIKRVIDGNGGNLMGELMDIKTKKGIEKTQLPIK